MQPSVGGTSHPFCGRPTAFAAPSCQLFHHLWAQGTLHSKRSVCFKALELIGELV